MALELVSKSPARQDTTSSTVSTSSVGSSRSTHIVYNPRTFKLDALDQEDFEHCKGLIRTNSPGRSLDADLYMNVGSEKNPVKARYATVDVGKLGWRISLQRLLGMHQDIYVQA